MNGKKERPLYSIVFFMSIAFLSISFVSSIGVWINKSFYFDGYIYNSYLFPVLSEYCGNVNRIVTGDMTEEEKEAFQSEYYGIYYYITNESTKEVFSNIPNGIGYIEFSSQADVVSLRYEDNQNADLIRTNNFKIEEKVQGISDAIAANFSGHVFIDTSVGVMLSTSFHYTIETGFSLQKVLYVESAVLVVSLLMGSILCLISFKKAFNYIIMQTDFIPLDVKIVIPIIAMTLCVFLKNTYFHTIIRFSSLTSRIILYMVLVGLMFIILYFLVIFILKIRQYSRSKTKFKQEWENRLTKNTPIWMIGLVLQLVWYFLIITDFYQAPAIYDYTKMLRHKGPVIIMHSVIITTVFLLIRQIQKSKTRYIKEVLYTTQEIANGNFELQVPVVGNDGYAQIADTINTIIQGYIHALEEQKKSERLKYELVTNISHDLRTPLTSILNYVGLAKKEGLSGEIERYINHAEANAKQLNVLIEDLFELSKMESGNMRLEISSVDIVLMLKQIGHEYEEKMEQNRLALILEHTSSHMIWQCDSLKIWRVFDNVINNAVKYSLPGTRIYIAIKKDNENGSIQISVKNIASYKMAFDAQELFLRFKRSDDARNTEGSGLGLAIAKSIVILHGGSIRIETEGDMFKVIIEVIEML